MASKWLAAMGLGCGVASLSFLNVLGPHASVDQAGASVLMNSVARSNSDPEPPSSSTEESDPLVQERQRAAGLLNQGLEAGAPDRAGLSGWDADQTVFTVRASSLTAAEISTIEAFAIEHDFQVAFELGGPTIAALEDLQSTLVDVAGPVLGEHGWVAGIDMVDEAVELVISDDELAEGEFETLQAEVMDGVSDVLESADGELSQPLTGLTISIESGTTELIDQRDQSPNYAGDWLAVNNALACTTGYQFRNGDTFRMSTAGHCMASGPGVGVVGGPVNYLDIDGNQMPERIGYGKLNYYGNYGTDVLLYSLPPSGENRNRIATGESAFRKVTGARASTAMALNESQCFVGHASFREDGKNAKCGPLEKRNISAHPAGTPDNFRIERLWCLKARSRGGDSGGPVYTTSGGSTSADALGISTLSFNYGSTYWNCYTLVGDITAASGYTLVTEK